MQTERCKGDVKRKSFGSCASTPGSWHLNKLSISLKAARVSPARAMFEVVRHGICGYEGESTTRLRDVDRRGCCQHRRDEGDRIAKIEQRFIIHVFPFDSTPKHIQYSNLSRFAKHAGTVAIIHGEESSYYDSVYSMIFSSRTPLYETLSSFYLVFCRVRREQKRETLQMSRK